jgi:hypothetical protein
LRVFTRLLLDKRREADELNLLVEVMNDLAQALVVQKIEHGFAIFRMGADIPLERLLPLDERAHARAGSPQHGIRRIRNNAAKRIGLQQAAHFENGANVGAVELRKLKTATDALDETRLRQHDEGLARRRARHAKFLGDLNLGQLVARAYLTFNNAPA